MIFNKNKIEYFLLISISKLLGIFGFNSIKYTSKVLASLFFFVIRIRRKVVIKNIKIAFPELDNKEIKKLAFKNYESVAITFLEIFNLNKLDKEIIKERFVIEATELYYEKYAENNGLILLTAHFGNWELAAVSAGISINETINILVKKQRNSYVANWLSETRERFGNVQIFLGISVRELFRILKNKGIIGIVGDQRGKRNGVKVNFFGRETSTFPGTAAIAIKTKCPVLVFFPTRKSDGKYYSTIQEIKHEKFTGTTEEKIKAFNQEFMRLLEEKIKEYPEQWLWMHNIWKY